MQAFYRFETAFSTRWNRECSKLKDGLEAAWIALAGEKLRLVAGKFKV
jgi:hypothetical protein